MPEVPSQVDGEEVVKARVHQVVETKISDLKPHPRNYRKHPEDQLAHIIASIKAHGYYRNVVVAKDGTILAGHGVVEASKKMGLKTVPVIRLSIGPNTPAALKVLTSDNEISNLAEVDDRVLTGLLKELSNVDDLVGTGFDKEMLAALTFVTRPASEVRDLNEAAHWVGMPAYEEGGTPIRLIVSFKKREDLEEFVSKHNLKIDKSAIKGETWSTRWPWTEREDSAKIKFERKGNRKKGGA